MLLNRLEGRKDKTGFIRHECLRNWTICFCFIQQIIIIIIIIINTVRSRRRNREGLLDLL